MNKALVLFAVILFAATGALAQHTAPMPTLSGGTLIRHENFPSRFIAARNVDVWLPDGYDTTRRYAVLYMHDGQMLFDSTVTWNKQEWGVDEVATQLIANGTIRPCIVVAVWNSVNGRFSDYFPQKPFEYLPERLRDSLLQHIQNAEQTELRPDHVRSDKYLQFLVTELKPFIDQHYATLTDPVNTCIAGSSRGGLISMYAFCEYPEVFGGAACLSTHWPGTYTNENNPIPAAFVRYMREALPPAGDNRIYFDYGTTTLDSLYEPHQLLVDQVMREKGYTSRNWETRKFEGAPHTENAWNKRLHLPLTFLLGTKNE
ncbi:MAG: alpha/beta hydrolase [Bacteroidetes bacterium]|nr:MAG: alpha/beta hydrolase [Bacteroidota bacterium]